MKKSLCVLIAMFIILSCQKKQTYTFTILQYYISTPEKDGYPYHFKKITSMTDINKKEAEKFKTLNNYIDSTYVIMDSVQYKIVLKQICDYYVD